MLIEQSFVYTLKDMVNSVGKLEDENARGEAICEVFILLQTPNGIELLNKYPNFKNQTQKTIKKLYAEVEFISDTLIKNSLLVLMDSFSLIFENLEQQKADLEQQKADLEPQESDSQEADLEQQEADLEQQEADLEQQEA